MEAPPAEEARLHEVVDARVPDGDGAAAATLLSLVSPDTDSPPTPPSNDDDLEEEEEDEGEDVDSDATVINNDVVEYWRKKLRLEGGKLSERHGDFRVHPNRGRDLRLGDTFRIILFTAVQAGPFSCDLIVKGAKIGDGEDYCVLVYVPRRAIDKGTKYALHVLTANPTTGALKSFPFDDACKKSNMEESIDPELACYPLLKTTKPNLTKWKEFIRSHFRDPTADPVTPRASTSGPRARTSARGASVQTRTRRQAPKPIYTPQPFVLTKRSRSTATTNTTTTAAPTSSSKPKRQRGKKKTKLDAAGVEDDIN